MPTCRKRPPVNDCVVDASALILSLASTTDEARTLGRRLSVAYVHAPHLIDAEVGNVLRRHEREGKVGQRESMAIFTASKAVVDRRHPHAGPLGGTRVEMARQRQRL